MMSNQKACWLVSAWAAFGVGQLCGQILARERDRCLRLKWPRSSRQTAITRIPSVSTATESRTMNVTARNLIEQAYGIPWTPGRNERVVGGPSWIDNNRYDVEARIDDSLVARFEKLSNEERKAQMSLMMESLLADRFKLKVHFLSSELPIYGLIIAKGGPKLTVTKDVPTPPEMTCRPRRSAFLRGPRMSARGFSFYIGDRPPK